jgi:hypothetical protein
LVFACAVGPALFCGPEVLEHAARIERHRVKVNAAIPVLVLMFMGGSPFIRLPFLLS